jgi:hypothetical protein
MTRRRRLARRLALAGAVAVAIALVAGVAWSTTRDTVIAVGTASAWPAQEAEIEQALDRVDLPASFAPIACRDLPDGYVRCWRFEGVPADALPFLEKSVTAAAVDDVIADCDSAPMIDGDAAGCTASGLVADRTVVLRVSRDVHPDARSMDRFAADTSTVALGADLTAP